jgi:amino-acid N-acetyltransferase
MPEQFHHGVRITDDDTLAIAGDAASHQRLHLERMMSTGLPNTPLLGARLRVMSGNFVTARPLGIYDGVDYLHSGAVRRVDAEGIVSVLDNDAIASYFTIGLLTCRSAV